MSSNNLLYHRPSDNVAPSATVSLTAGTAAGGYPVGFLTDLSDMNRGFPSLLTSGTGTWKIDFGGAQALQGIVVWHNCDAGLTITAQGDNGSGSPTTITTITAAAKRTDGYTVKQHFDFRALSLTYHRYYIAIAGNSVPLGLKVLAISAWRQPTINIDWGINYTEIHGGIVQRTDAGYTWGYDTQEAWRLLKGSWTYQSDTDRDAVRDWFRSMAGCVGITAIMPDPTINDVWLGRWNTGQTTGIVRPQLAATLNAINVSQQSIEFEEAQAGGPEWT